MHRFKVASDAKLALEKMNGFLLAGRQASLQHLSTESFKSALTHFSTVPFRSASTWLPKRATLTEVLVDIQDQAALNNAPAAAGALPGESETSLAKASVNMASFFVPCSCVGRWISDAPLLPLPPAGNMNNISRIDLMHKLSRNDRAPEIPKPQMYVSIELLGGGLVL
jgi:hypothetical protein